MHNYSIIKYPIITHYVEIIKVIEKYLEEEVMVEEVLEEVEDLWLVITIRN
jgi:hypothetical protein